MRYIEFKVSHQDIVVHFAAISLFMQYVSTIMELGDQRAVVHVQFSLLWNEHRALQKYFFKRNHPASKTLKMDPHIAHTYNDALMYLLSKTECNKEKAAARRLFEQINCRLTHQDRDNYLIN